MLNIYSVYSSASELPFLRYQFECLIRYCRYLWDLIIINNGQTPLLQDEIRDLCYTIGIPCKDVEQPNHTLHGLSHQTAMNWALDKFILRDNKLTSVLCDADMFLINELQLGNGSTYDIAGVKQRRNKYTYLWPGVLYIKSKVKALSLSGCCVNDTHLDSGGMTYYRSDLVKRYLSIKYLHKRSKVFSIIPDKIKSNYQDNFNMQLIDGVWLHSSRLSGWMPESAEHKLSKSKVLRSILEDKLAN